jgi:dihydroorotate dehydrogenase (NAD+) catalytic subunit
VSKSSGVSSSVTRVGSVELKSPVMNASGTAGHGTELHRYVNLSSLGAFVVKSLAPFEWAGNASPRLSPTAGGMLNAVGLQGPGIEYWITHDLPKLLDVGANIVVSIWGFGVDDYAQAAQMLRPVAHQLSALEINLSCPNTKSATDSSARHAIFAHEPQLVEEIVKASIIDGVPAWAKLSPNTHLVIEGARAAQRGGAQAVTLINTALGMSMNPTTGLPSLGNGGGGLSGRSVHPIAVRVIYEVAANVHGLPIIGAGGVTSGWEAIELMLAGASAVQVGTASFAEPRAMSRIQREMIQWAKRHDVNDWSEIVGLAHRGGISAL